MDIAEKTSTHAHPCRLDSPLCPVDPDTETLTEHAPEWMAWIENANESRGR